MIVESVTHRTTLMDVSHQLSSLAWEGLSLLSDVKEGKSASVPSHVHKLSSRLGQRKNNHTNPGESDKPCLHSDPAETIASPLAYTRSRRYNTTDPLVINPVTGQPHHAE